MRNIRDQKGFTLIELMIVVVIIGILAALAIPRFTQTARSSRNAEAGPVMKQICTLANAQIETGTPPQSLPEITMFSEPGDNSRFTYTYTPGAGIEPGTAVATANDDSVDSQELVCTEV